MLNPIIYTLLHFVNKICVLSITDFLSFKVKYYLFVIKSNIKILITIKFRQGETIMTFRDDFLRLIDSTTIYRLSKSTGIERTKLQRIKSGQKLPTKEELEIISRELSLTPDEKENIFTELEIALIGEDKYKSRIHTKRFIEQLYNIFNNESANSISTSEINLNTNSIYTTNTTTETNALINSFMNAETSKENHIYIYNSVTAGEMFENIYSKIINHPKLSVTHIIGFKPHNDTYESYYANVNIISKIYPVFLSQTNYYVYYYYDKVKENSMFSYTVISDNYTLMLSYNFKYAILTNNENVVKTTKLVFEEKIKNSYPLISDITDVLSYSNIYVEHHSKYNQNDTQLITIEYEPCVFPYLDSELVKLLLKKDIPNYNTIVERCLNIKDSYSKIKLSQSYFTKAGVQNFIDNGRINEIPEFVYDPIPFEIRIELLEKLCYDAKISKIKELHLINDNKLKVPENLRYCGNGQLNDFFLLLSKKAQKPSIIRLNECGFAKPFYDFASHLRETDMVFSNDETVDYIESCIQKYK